jgi:putative FmdB family regulatory protein
MPLYDYRCRDCGFTSEHLVPLEQRDTATVLCGHCLGGNTVRVIVAAPKLGKERYQMKAVLNDGSHVAGHFGKSAPLYRKGKA